MGVLRVAMRAADEALDILQEHDSLESQANETSMLPRSELYDLLNYDPVGDPWQFPVGNASK